MQSNSTSVAPRGPARRRDALFVQLKLPHIRLPAYITRVYRLSISYFDFLTKNSKSRSAQSNLTFTHIDINTII